MNPSETTEPTTAEILTIVKQILREIRQIKILVKPKAMGEHSTKK